VYFKEERELVMQMERYPNKLTAGAHVRVIAPATSLAVITAEQRATATQRFQEMGLSVSFSKHAEEIDLMGSSALAERVDDLHAAFADPHVDAVITVLGGYNSHQLLPYLDYELIRSNPKIFCGYSDITALSNALYAKTGLVTYSGPHYSTFGMQKGIEYTTEYFKKCFFSAEPYEVLPAPTWSDDAWYRDQENRDFIPHEGYVVLQEGEAEGTLIGGNASTLILLNGTPYLPPLAGSILMLEDDLEATPHAFQRYLQALIHQPGFEGVRGLVIGRFQKATNMTDELLRYIISTKRELRGLPIIAQANFGHTTPQFTFPIGGQGTMSAVGDMGRFSITRH
jgi:muramoyltetrapeptide carboxypeptidase